MAGSIAVMRRTVNADDGGSIPLLPAIDSPRGSRVIGKLKVWTTLDGSPSALGKLTRLRHLCSLPRRGIVIGIGRQSKLVWGGDG